MRGKNSKEVPLFDESLNGEVENNAEQNKNERDLLFSKKPE